MVLFFPPAVRPCEPPAGLSRLAGVLREAGESVILIDGALEGMISLTEEKPSDNASGSVRRVYRSRKRIRENLSTPRGYTSFDRYKKNISDLNLLLQRERSEEKITPVDYRHSARSPLRSADLKYAYDFPEENPYYPWFSRRIFEIFSRGRESILALSLCFLTQALTALAILGYMKKEFPRVKTVLGGSLISSWTRGPGDLDFLKGIVDKIIAGPGEEELCAIAGREYRGPGAPWFGSLADDSYLAPGLILPYSAASSCSWKRCTFCAETWENYTYKHLNVEAAHGQLTTLVRQYKPLLIHLTDSEINPDFMTALVDSPPGTDWYGFSRFLPAMINPGFCRALAVSGCRMLCLGLESGDQQVLNKLKKGIQLDQVELILKNLKEAGIGTFVYLLFGTPAENRKGAENTRDFIYKHRKKIDFLNLAVFSLPVISRECEELETSSFYQGDLSLSVDFTHPEGWNRREVRRFLDREFRKNRELRSILNRTPPLFTSSHAPFFC